MLLNILVNTHGGLGNQIFQIFYALNLSEKLDAKLSLNHIAYYKHGFTLQVPTMKLDIGKPSNFDLILMHSRIGKIMEKTKLSSGNIKICNKIILDGYFQDSTIYNDFTNQCIKKSLDKLRVAFEISPFTIDVELMHLRLGDFFKTSQEKLDQAKKSLAEAKKGQHIITNDEDLLLLPEYADILEEKQLRLVKTANLSGYELLRLFSSYIKIRSNGSTLALWAALLSGADLKINNEKLQNFYKSISRLES